MTDSSSATTREPRDGGSLRPFALGVVFVAILIGVTAVAYHLMVERGARITINFARKGELKAGAQVTLDGRVIGVVESVDPDGRKMTVHVRLRSGAERPLPRDVTFLVTADDEGRESQLEAHVLDPEAPPLEDGDEVTGVGSQLELAIRRGARSANDLMREARKQLESAREELETIDWEQLGREAGERSEQVISELERLAEKSGREVERGLETVEPVIEELIRDLKEVGRSEEAQRLKERLDALWKKHVKRSGSPTPTPQE